ncbi:MAG: leucine-rich repeat protein, partial [Clostridia bacterium]|nr:leucine-rich repeat protein [Clostridia bacterium]
MKRSAACLLALTLFFASVPLSGMAEAVDVEVVKPDLGQTELVLGETVTVTIDVEEEVLVYSFTPETTGYYVFEASGDVDSQAYLYDAEGTEIAYSDDYTGTNFCIRTSLMAGQTYFLHARCYGTSIGSYTLTLTELESPIVGVEIWEPISLIENFDGEYTQDSYEDGDETQMTEEYFKYSFYTPSFTFILSDGTEEYGEGLWWDGDYQAVKWTDPQSYETPWTVGNTYAVEALVAGFAFTFDVTIEENPIESVTVDKIYPIANVTGQTRSEEYEDEQGEWQTAEYFHYSCAPYSYTVKLKDGTEISDTGSSVYLNGSWYEFIYQDPQSYQNPWEEGNTYELTGSVAGHRFTYEAEIIDTPIESVEIDKVLNLEHLGGEWTTDLEFNDDGCGYVESEEYYRYEYNPTQSVITLKNGKVYEDGGFVWDGIYYSFNVEDPQSAKNPWTLGNTYTLNGSIAGYDFTYEVEIVDTPVASVEVEPIQLVKEQNGYWTNGDDYGCGDICETQRYFHYYGYRPVNYTIILKDGTRCENSNFYWNGRWYGLECYDTQSALNPWLPGNTYEMVGNVAGYEFTYEVEVIESPILSVEVEPIQLIEGTNGYWDRHYGEDEEGNRIDLEFFHYYCQPRKYTIRMRDGSVYENESILWNGEWHGVGYSDPQNAENQWAVGNTYTTTGSILGYEFTYEVEIIETPVASVEIEPRRLLAEQDGYWTWDYVYNEELGCDEEVEYFRYYCDPVQYTITMKDGTVYVNESVEWDGEWHSPENEADQGAENPWLAGNTYEVKGSILGYEFIYDVEIIGSLVESVEVQPIRVTEGINGYRDYDYVDGEEKYYYRYEYEPQYTITLIDGTTIEDNYFDYEGNYYHVSLNDGQAWDSAWQSGNTYTVKGEIAGYEFSFPVEVEASPVVSVVVEPLQITAGTNGHWSWDSIYDEETDSFKEMQYFRYEVPIRNYTITMKDGTVYENQDAEWNGDWYCINYHNPQSYENQWSEGNTYEVEGSIMGYEFTFQVEITESPIASVVVEPLVLIENSNGYWNTEYYYDEATDTEKSVEYYRYYCSPSRYTVTMKDGTVYKDRLIWDGTYYSINYDNPQDRENQWTVGNTYTVEGSLMGYRLSYEVEIVESPVASVTVEPVQLIEGSDGDWDWDYIYNEDLGYSEEVRYFRYDYSPNRYTITMKDGTVYKNEGFEWNDRWYGIECSANQNYENQWTVGNTYEAQGSIAGYTFTYTAEIIDTPVASVEVEPLQLVENQNGYWDWDYIYNAEQDSYDEVEYFRYYTTPNSYTVTMKDGTVYRNGGFYWNGRWYNLSWSDNQSAENPWTMGLVYEASGSVAGYEFTYEVEIVNLGNNGIYEYREGANSIVITDCFEAGETLEIPSHINDKPVTGIAYLGDLYGVKHLIIPDTVTTIGDYLIESLSDGLESIHFGSGVKNLRAYMFEYCYDLLEITVSEESDTYCVIDHALYNKALDTFVAYPAALGGTLTVYKTVVNVDALDMHVYRRLNVVFPADHILYVTEDGVTYNKDKTKIIFCNKNKAGSYDMPDTVVEITASAFEDCDYLTEVIVSSGVTEIVYHSFASCNSLADVKLPNGLVSIGEGAFRDTPALEEIELPDTLERVENLAFKDGGLTALTLPDSLKYVGTAAFRDTSILTLDLGEGVELIEGYAFADTPVSAVVLPNSLTALGEYAFNNCQNLTSLLIGTGLKGISGFAFCDTALESVTLPPNINWVGEGAFMHSNLKTVTFQNPAVELGEYAFAYCQLENLELGEEMTYLDSYTFAGNAMTEVDIPDSVTDIVYATFVNCESLADIRIPDTLIHIGGHSFDNTAWYNNQPDGATYLDYVLYDWKGAMPMDAAIVLENGATLMADYAFAEQPNMATVRLPNTLERIGNYAFAHSTGLESIHIPADVVYIGEDAFRGCVGITSITVDPANEYYTVIDGALYTIDGEQCIFNPAWYEEIYWLWIENTPNKTILHQGEELDTTGLTLGVSYEDWGLSALLTRGFEVSGYNPNVAGEQYVTISYKGCETGYWVEVVAHDWKAATCTAPKTCKICGETEGKALGHKWDDATCTTPKTCSVCGETEGEALGHEWDDATCTAPKTCSVCGETEGEALGHEWDDATCTTPKTCSVCGETEGEALGHEWDDATCTTPKTCSVCGETEGEALGHEWDDATCTAPKTCSVCGETEGEALGHEWDDATCTAPKTCSVCGETEGEALGHDYKAATCTTAKTCKVCGETEGEALGHRWDDAPCTVRRTCSVCGETEGEALGHKWDDATCTTPKTCSVCGETEGEALGHEWDDATCTAPKTC